MKKGQDLNMPSLTTKLLGLIRFSHTLFALPFALASAMIAWDHQGFEPFTLLGIVVCLGCARSAAMAFNRLVDRHLDAKNPRTASRHLPSGQLSVGEVSCFVILTSLGFVLGTLIFLPLGNWYPLYFCCPVLLWLLGYSYAKRFTSLAHYWLGLALACAPSGAWVAIRGDQIWGELAVPSVLSFAVLFWVAGFDIIYACQDEAFDRTTGLFSLPSRVGARNALCLAGLSHGIMVGLLALLPWAEPKMGGIYWAGLAMVALILCYEHSLVRPGELKRVEMAFFWMNIAVSLGLWLVICFQLAWVRVHDG